MSQKATAWSFQYEMANTPWDLGRPHPELTARLSADPTLGTGRLGRALVPGCGLGHDAVAQADAGWAVTGLDFAGSLAGRLDDRIEFHCADAFTYQPDQPFDLVLDHTFFCAVPPERRAALGKQIAGWVDRAGILASLVFPIGRDECLGGPPFAMSVEDLTEALGAAFAMTANEVADDAGRPWPTRWAAFERS